MRASIGSLDELESGKSSPSLVEVQRNKHRGSSDAVTVSTTTVTATGSLSSQAARPRVRLGVLIACWIVGFVSLAWGVLIVLDYFYHFLTALSPAVPLQDVFGFLLVLSITVQMALLSSGNLERHVKILFAIFALVAILSTGTPAAVVLFAKRALGARLLLIGAFVFVATVETLLLVAVIWDRHRLGQLLLPFPRAPLIL